MIELFLWKKKFTIFFLLLFRLIKAPTGNNCQKNRNRIVLFRAPITNKIFTRLRWMGYCRGCVIPSIKPGLFFFKDFEGGLIGRYYCLLNAVVHKFYCGTAASDWYSIFWQVQCPFYSLDFEHCSVRIDGRFPRKSLVRIKKDSKTNAEIVYTEFGYNEKKWFV